MPSDSAGQCGYEFGWRFKRDWVRDGIPWFILPATQVTAETNGYNQTKLEFVRARLEGTSKREYLREVLSNVLQTRSSKQAMLEAIVRFVQDATWHNPLECPFETDQQTIVTAAHELLELHDARCWHTAEIVRQLCLAAGWDARITFLPSAYSPSVHVVTEVSLDGTWRVADANYFKGGVILRTPDGALPTLDWLRQNPQYPDCLPGGWIFPREYLTNAAHVLVKGQFAVPFVDAEDTWGSESRYSYYLGETEWFPPSRPTGLEIRQIDRGRYVLTWQPSRSLSSVQIMYEVTLSRLRDGAAWKSPMIDGTQARLPELVSGTAYSTSVAAIDEQRERERRIWYPPAAVSFVP